MRVARGAGHAAVGNDAADRHGLDARATQHPVKLRVEEGGIRDFPHRHIDEIVECGNCRVTV